MPAYLRVKIGRRLQALGAVPVKNSVYVLPSGEETLEDFQWVRREILAGRGEAWVCQARFVEGLTDAAVEALFNGARDADYALLAREARQLRETLARPRKRGAGVPERATAALLRLRKRLEEVRGIDFFGAEGRETVEGILSAVEAALRPSSAAAANGPPVPTVRGRTWVTRQDVHVDRIASAWLVRRFVDPEAEFLYVPTAEVKRVSLEKTATAYDIPDVEFSHEGERCSFDAFLKYYGLKDPALEELALIVRGADTNRLELAPQAAGLAAISLGLSLNYRNDHEMLEHGMVMYDALHAWCKGGKDEVHTWNPALYR